jgi:hypothetical protein
MIFDCSYEMVHGVQHGLASFDLLLLNAQGDVLRRVIWFDTDSMKAVAYPGHLEVVDVADYGFYYPTGDEGHRDRLLLCLPPEQRSRVREGKIILVSEPIA